VPSQAWAYEPDIFQFTYDPNRSFRAWLAVVVGNKWRELNRKRRALEAQVAALRAEVENEESELERVRRGETARRDADLAMVSATARLRRADLDAVKPEPKPTRKPKRAGVRS